MTTTNPAGSGSPGTIVAGPPAFPASHRATGRPMAPALRPLPAFSLVEIVLALGLVSFSMLAIFALVAQGHRTSRESRLESVSAILAGRINSLFRASAAWDAGVTNFTGNRTLTEIAAGTAVTVTNYLDLNLSNVSSADPERQFAVITEVGPISAAKLTTGNPEVADALTQLGPAANTVFLNIEISQPALAPPSNRLKRHFSSIITRTSPN